MKKNTALILTLFTSFAFAINSAHAAVITSSSDPLLAGGTVETFDAASSGTYSSITLGNVSYSVESGALLTIGSDYIGSYNTSGTQSLYNTYESYAFGELTVNFSSPVNAFGFNWGAADTTWILTAYDSSSSILGTFALPATTSSNAGEFYGLGGFSSAISYATIIGDKGDYVFVDNLITAVPEPETYAMLLAGLGLLGFTARRRKNNV